MAFRAVLFHDDQHWVELAAKTRYPLPPAGTQLAVDRMRLWLDRLDRSEEWHRTAFGCTLAEFVELNPRWGLRSWVGILLEATIGAH